MLDKECYFIFKGINSLDMGINISSFPQLIKPKRQFQQLQIPGRSGSLYLDNNTYESYSINIGCVISPFNENKKDLQEIMQWLSGTGDLILSYDRDKIYNAYIFDGIAISDVIYNFPNFMVSFIVEPLKKHINYKNDIIEIIEPTTIYNKGMVASYPIITIYGNGNVSLTVNEQIFNIQNINEFITINSEIMEVYKNSENQNNKYNNFSFPIFTEQKNTVSFSGDITKIIIDPNFRWV